MLTITAALKSNDAPERLTPPQKVWTWVLLLLVVMQLWLRWTMRLLMYLSWWQVWKQLSFQSEQPVPLANRQQLRILQNAEENMPLLKLILISFSVGSSSWTSRLLEGLMRVKSSERVYCPRVGVFCELVFLKNRQSNESGQLNGQNVASLLSSQVILGPTCEKQNSTFIVVTVCTDFWYDRQQVVPLGIISTEPTIYNGDSVPTTISHKPTHKHICNIIIIIFLSTQLVHNLQINFIHK